MGRRVRLQREQTGSGSPTGAGPPGWAGPGRARCSGGLPEPDGCARMEWGAAARKGVGSRPGGVQNCQGASASGVTVQKLPFPERWGLGSSYLLGWDFNAKEPGLFPKQTHSVMLHSTLSRAHPLPGAASPGGVCRWSALDASCSRTAHRLGSAGAGHTQYGFLSVRSESTRARNAVRRNFGVEVGAVRATD